MPHPLLFSIIPVGNSAFFRLHLRADSRLQGNRKDKSRTDLLQCTDHFQDAENHDQLKPTSNPAESNHDYGELDLDPPGDPIPDYATDELEA
eukprot:1872076-Rhodomonas_salina.1